jgi:membrane fusion protein (multidrug efflux system)
MMKAAPIVTIINMDTVKILMGVNEKDVSRVTIGLDTEIRVDAWPGKVFKGKVTNVAPIVNPLNRTTEVEVLIENRDGALKPGMFARVAIVIEAHENAVVVPHDAVVESESGRSVFVVEGDRASRRTLTTGFLDGAALEVRSGLKGGERLIVIGQQRLKDGVKVKAQAVGGMQ